MLRKVQASRSQRGIDMGVTEFNAKFGLKNRHSFFYDRSKSAGKLTLYCYTSSYSCGHLNCDTAYKDHTVSIPFRGPEDISQIIQGLVEASAGHHFSFFGEDGNLIEIWSNGSQLTASYPTSDRGKYWCKQDDVNTCCPVNMKGITEGQGQLTKEEAGRLFQIMIALLRTFPDYSETVVRFQKTEIG